MAEADVKTKIPSALTHISKLQSPIPIPMNAVANLTAAELATDHKDRDLAALYRASGIGDVFAMLDRVLFGLKPFKSRIREIAALLLVDKARNALGLIAGAPSRH